jgi:hypothetical protein
MAKNKIDEFNLRVDLEDLEWMDLSELPQNVYNPFEDYPIGGQPDPIDEMMGIITNHNYIHFFCKSILGLEILPFQAAILDILWRYRLPMLIGTRGMSKSFILALYAILRMVLHPGCRVCIVGSSFRQSRQVFDYMVNIWDKSPILRDIAGNDKSSGPKREVDRCQFKIGDSVTVCLPIGDGSKIRGIRANYILADEFASIPEEIFNLVIQGFAIVSASPVDKVKELAIIRKLKKMGRWSIEMETARALSATGNQIVYSGTAYYAFNHFAKTFEKWYKIISSKGDLNKLKETFGDGGSIPDGFNWKDYAILRVPYTSIPEGFLDPGILAQAKATLNNAQFLMEYAATFVSDSDGFYKRSVIEAATTNKPILIENNEYVQFSAKRAGSKENVYVMAIDPAADQDNAAIVILEVHKNHRRIVNCWTTNRRKYNSYKKYMAESNIEIEDDYYRYIAKKIRSFMRIFNICHIIMDKNGGGIAIQEALESKYSYEEGEFPIYQMIDPEDPKQTDVHKGLHILEMLVPTNDINVESNHGMLKDLQDKVLLFPMFDAVELAKSIEIDNINNIKFDTYEDLVQEIEELKNEMTTIVVKPSSNLGKETFDTPEIKMDGQKKGRLRKDRYSALLYANYYCRNKEKSDVYKVEYKPVGGTRETISTTVINGACLYRGPGMAKFGQNKWNSTNNIKFIKHK